MINAMILTPEGMQHVIIQAPPADLDVIVAHLGEGYRWVELPKDFHVTG